LTSAEGPVTRGPATTAKSDRQVPRANLGVRPARLLLAVLLAGVALRLWLLTGPLGEVEADESVVGLMALHILQGERPVFYWGQPYLGSLEAYLVAAVFAVFGPSNIALKSVPGLVFLGFVLLIYYGARHDFGSSTALGTALYLALPPAFLAFWSLKARGGYVELLLLGHGLWLLVGWAGRSRGGLTGKVALSGLAAGALIWTHVLGLVYLLPASLYLLFRVGRRLLGLPLLGGLVGLLVGLSPALFYNAEHQGETWTALSAGGSTEQTVRENLATFATVGLPVMAGLGQATSSPILFAEDWPHRLASRRWTAPLLLVALLFLLLPAVPLGPDDWRRALRTEQVTRLGGLALLVLVPLVASLGRFGELIAEPRYALPLYGALPLLMYAGCRLNRRASGVSAVLLGSAIALNLSSLLTADPRLNLPTTAAGSTAANRAELIDELERSGTSELYADYWLAYPLMFESGERLMAAVSSGGYNRFAPYTYYVTESADPAFVFIAGSREEVAFATRLASFGGDAHRDSVGIYAIYRRVEPLALVRP
jgi:4-amino-4-deoxy-L-arabinose transferase-like glycosyltransferase